MGKKLGVKCDVVQHDDLARQYPQMNTNGAVVALYTPSTGVLKAWVRSSAASRCGP